MNQILFALVRIGDWPVDLCLSSRYAPMNAISEKINANSQYIDGKLLYNEGMITSSINAGMKENDNAAIRIRYISFLWALLFLRIAEYADKKANSMYR